MVGSGGEITLPAPHPSPIPTGKGSRSAANDILSEYLQRALNVPDLTLPQPHLPLNDDATDHLPTTTTTASDTGASASSDLPSALSPIDLRSLESGDRGSIDRLLWSAREVGAFRITGIGNVLRSPLQSLAQEAERIFQVLGERDTGFRLDSSHREQIAWIPSHKDEERMKWARDYIGAHSYRHLSERMENVASNLEAVAQKLFGLLLKDRGNKQFGKRPRVEENILYLYRYSHCGQEELNRPSTNENNGEVGDHTLSLHLPGRHSKFFVPSAQGPLSFDAGPDTLVVYLGRRSKEWSMEDFQCIPGEVFCQPYHQGEQASFSVELKCLSPNFDAAFSRNTENRSISLRDQLLIGLLLVFLYNVVVSLCSSPSKWSN